MDILSIDKLIRLLRSDVIPRIESKEHSRFFVARAKAHGLIVPEDVTITPRKLLGTRKVVKDQRNHDNHRYFTAKWPDDNLQELAYAKIVYITEGIADYLLGDYCAHCPPGTFFLIPPGVPHQCLAPHLTKERQKNGHCALLQIYAYQHGVHFWFSYSHNDQRFNSAENNYFIYSLSAAQALHFAVKEAEENSSHLDAIIRGFTIALLAVVAREIETGNYSQPGPGKDPVAPVQSEDFIGEIRQYMEANCHKELRLEGVAADLFMSRSRLARLLRKEMNTTFIELLTQYRIERACFMLRESNRTFISISRSLGFRSPSNFHSVFHAHMGCTPMEYRQKHSSKINN